MIDKFAFKVRYLAINDGAIDQILSQEYTGFSVWAGEPFHDSDNKKYVARYIERGPISLQKLSAQDDIITYSTKSDLAKACTKRVLELNPLECPRCKSKMRIVAFLNDTREIKIIMESLGIPTSEPPHKIPNKNNLFSEIVDPIYDDF